MQSAILTSPENITALKEKRAIADAKKAEAAAKKETPKKATPKKAAIASPPAKRTKLTKKTRQQKSPPDEKSASEDDDFCIIFIEVLPKKLTAANFIKCKVCKRPVHLKCACMTRGYFTCKHCDSDSDWDEEDDG